MSLVLALVFSLALAAPAAAESSVERGKYLVEVLGACGNCHSPKQPGGEVPGKHLAGGFEIPETFGVAVVPNITPDSETGIGRWKDVAITRVADPPIGDLVKYGAYLAGPVAHCVECHTPADATMKPDASRFLAGGFRFTGPFGVSYSTNLTPDRETGIGSWTDAQIIAAINGSDPTGRVAMPPMPWPYY